MQKVNIARKEMAAGFAKVWNHKGVVIVLDDVHFAFATDFSNMLFASFFEQQAQAAAKAAELKKIKIVEG
jgi:hypothetical protein